MFYKHESCGQCTPCREVSELKYLKHWKLSLQSKISPWETPSTLFFLGYRLDEYNDVEVHWGQRAARGDWYDLGTEQTGKAQKSEIPYFPIEGHCIIIIISLADWGPHHLRSGWRRCLASPGSYQALQARAGKQVKSVFYYLPFLLLSRTWTSLNWKHFITWSFTIDSFHNLSTEQHF